MDFSHDPSATLRHILISIPLISTKENDCVAILKHTQIALWLQAILCSTTTYKLIDNELRDIGTFLLPLPVPSVPVNFHQVEKRQWADDVC